MGTYFVPDNSEFRTDSIDSLREFFEEREKTTTWFTDDDNTRADSLRFKPIYAEPICIPADVENLKKSVMPKFVASEEAYADSMNDPDSGYFGSTQLIFVNGTLYPLGNSAISGLIKRAGLAVEGWKNLKEYKPNFLSEVLNRCMKAKDGYVCVLVQDEKVRAINSGRYAICPMSFVLKEMEAWIANERPKATFASSYVCHDFATWTIDLKEYADDVLGQFPELKQNGFTPSLIVSLSNTGAASVSLRPALTIGGVSFPLVNSIDCPHIATGDSHERTRLIQNAVSKNFEQVFPSMDKSVAEIDKLRSVKVTNAYNALKRGMKALGLPKEQSLETAEQFLGLYPDVATAYDCYVSIIDVFALITRDNPTDARKQFNAADAVARATKLDWVKLGNLPGFFEW